MSNAVNHPEHYGGEDSPYEAVKVISSWAESGRWDGTTGFNLGNALKYINRKGRKDPDKSVEDLEKAAEYLAFQIEYEKARIREADASVRAFGDFEVDF